MVDRLPEMGDSREKYLTEFGEKFSQGLPDFENAISEIEMPLPPDPSSLDIGDNRTVEELAPDEIDVIRDKLYEYFGVNTDDPENKIRHYQSEAAKEAEVPGIINITVYKTQKDGVVLQEMLFPDQSTRWVVGPDMDI